MALDDWGSSLDSIRGRLASRGFDTRASEVNEFLEREAPKRAVELTEEIQNRLAQTFIPMSEDTKRGKKSFDWYARINPSSPLSAEEHNNLAHQVEVGLFAEERLATVERLDRELKRDLQWLAREGRRAFSKLVHHNLRLVFTWSRGYIERTDYYLAQDAFQAGVIGLMRGLLSWDYKRGFTLSTYVTSHIRQQIQRWYANESQIVRIPVHVWERLRSSGALRGQADDEDWDDETPDDFEPEVADEANDKGIQSALVVLNPESLEEVNEDIYDEADSLPEDFATRALSNELLRRLIDTLEEGTAQVVYNRFGLLDGEPRTLDSVGVELGVTRERVRQVMQKAETELRVAVLMVMFLSFYDLRDWVEDTFGEDAFSEEFWDYLQRRFFNEGKKVKRNQSFESEIERLLQQIGQFRTPLAY